MSAGSSESAMSTTDAGRKHRSLETEVMKDSSAPQEAHLEDTTRTSWNTTEKVQGIGKKVSITAGNSGGAVDQDPMTTDTADENEKERGEKTKVSTKKILFFTHHF